MENKHFTDYETGDFLTDESFLNYCNNTNVDDAKFWKEWFLLHPEKLFIQEEAKELLQLLSLTLSESEYKFELARIKEAINKEPNSKTGLPSVFRYLVSKKEGFQKRANRKRSLKFIVAAVVVIGVAGYLYFQKTTPVSDLVEQINSGNSDLIFKLSDSTIVTLAPHSTLKYPAVFSEKSRNVFLEGNAGFHVTHNAAQPFRVHEGDIVATVLGTIFNCRKVPDNSTMIIELVQGKLQVDNVDEKGTAIHSVILNPNERVVYHLNSKELNKEVWVNNSKTSELNNIAFQRDNFEAIAKKMKEVFAVTLINQSKRKSWHFTGKFFNTTYKEVIENICVIEKTNYQVIGDTVLIK